MNHATSEIKESLSLILNKLEAIDSKLEQQEEDIKAYIEQSSASLESNDLLIAGLKSTRTSFELLRDEIDELHQLTVALFKGERE
ncbi:hypothetical protein Trichorick_01534 (plasmid) [Candidatus Trichorickettsia mobilis]|uniref:hypothetical protein n=1 Tax=Candidatus Trichorickettsia mobilis TaxID=1346319 RepID=UPI002B2621C1|nr:hypothetical protein [Candidatus Trichorickettsia mobilis]WPY01620.1 hypothetical protein Trichorick_01534 [Candidatus Trichorickettsia mobilis]